MRWILGEDMYLWLHPQYFFLAYNIANTTLVLECTVIICFPLNEKSIQKNALSPYTGLMFVSSVKNVENKKCENNASVSHIFGTIKYTTLPCVRRIRLCIPNILLEKTLVSLSDFSHA